MLSPANASFKHSAVRVPFNCVDIFFSFIKMLDYYI
jgi:hypothetical protein